MGCRVEPHLSPRAPHPGLHPPNWRPSGRRCGSRHHAGARRAPRGLRINPLRGVAAPVGTALRDGAGARRRGRRARGARGDRFSCRHALPRGARRRRDRARAGDRNRSAVSVGEPHPLGAGACLREHALRPDGGGGSGAGPRRGPANSAGDLGGGAGGDGRTAPRQRGTRRGPALGILPEPQLARVHERRRASGSLCPYPRSDRGSSGGVERGGAGRRSARAGDLGRRSRRSADRGVRDVRGSRDRDPCGTGDALRGLVRVRCA